MKNLLTKEDSERSKDFDDYRLRLGSLENKRLKNLVYEVCNRSIPIEVYKFVCDNVIFWEADNMMFSVSGLAKKTSKDFIVILTKKATEYSVAHEVAHCWLKHCTEVTDAIQDYISEQEAEDLAKK
jgi:hypothetical protein